MDQQQQQHEDNDHMYGGLEEKGEEDVAGKIFIGGLSWQTTEQTLRAHFERYGELTDVALMFDKRSNKPRYITVASIVVGLCYFSLKFLLFIVEDLVLLR